MKRVPFALLLLLLFAFETNAQTDAPAATQINEQIWRPFIKAYNNFDAEAFNSLHTDDVLRVTPWGIRKGETYFKKNIERYEKNKQNGNTRKLSFTFEYRIHSENEAYEVGYYKVVGVYDGEEKTHVGQFHVVLKKIDGIWKIAQDWDSDKINGVKLTAADFAKSAKNGIME